MMMTLLLAVQMMATVPEQLKPYTIDEPLTRPEAAKLVWSDEFDGSSVDRKKWRFDTAFNKRGWFNNEQQYYSKARQDNAKVAGGLLTITARADGFTLRGLEDWGGQRYTSARLLSKASWTYGYYEIRAKLPCSQGMWPAIWMLPPDMTKWPEDGEIDIMEHVGKTPGDVYATLHAENYVHTKNTQRGSIRKVATACSEFHTYQLDWRPDVIRVGVDGRAFMRVANDKPAEGKAAWPFDRPFQLILNLAVGGDWPGPVDDAALPQSLQVDYVRVWQ